MRIETPSRNTYIFQEENKYTVKPLSFEDLYFILLLDSSPIHRTFVFKIDPKAQTNERRIIIDTNFIDPELIKRQEENEAKERKIKLYEWYKKEYIDRLYNRIALWSIDEITKEPLTVPENLEELAEEYADKRMEELEKLDEEETDTPPLETELIVKDYTTMWFNQLLEEAKNLKIEVPENVKSKKWVIELINAKLEETNKWLEDILPVEWASDIVTPPTPTEANTETEWVPEVDLNQTKIDDIIDKTADVIDDTIITPPVEWENNLPPITTEEDKKDLQNPETPIQ